MLPNKLEIYFIRHAETTYNVGETIIGGRSNHVPLTEKGEIQAIELGGKLRDINFADVYSSPAVRTMYTTTLILSGVSTQFTVHIDGRLQEWYKGDWEGKLRKDIYERPDVKKQLETDNWNMVFGETVMGESAKNVAERMLDFVKTVVDKYKDGGKILVVTHGYAIKFLMAEMLDLDRKIAYQKHIGNCSVNVLEFDGEEYRWIDNLI